MWKDFWPHSLACSSCEGRKGRAPTIGPGSKLENTGEMKNDMWADAVKTWINLKLNEVQQLCKAVHLMSKYAFLKKSAGTRQLERTESRDLRAFAVNRMKRSWQCDASAKGSNTILQWIKRSTSSHSVLVIHIQDGWNKARTGAQKREWNDCTHGELKL